jgi:serine O-acetyltransferase
MLERRRRPDLHKGHVDSPVSIARAGAREDFTGVRTIMKNESFPPSSTQIDFSEPISGRPKREWDIGSIVDRLRESREVTHGVRFHGRIRDLPSRTELVAIVRNLCAAIFPTHFGRHDLTDESIDYFVGATLNDALLSLTEQIRRGLQFTLERPTDSDGQLQADAVLATRAFAHELPAIRNVLVTDLTAAYRGDPASTSISEILLCYRGVNAIIHYRLAHTLYRLGVPLVPRLIADIAHEATGVDIHPGARIGGHFFIDHGTGVVIGETAIVGEHVRLYQAVTLGAKRFPSDADGALIKGEPRHPIIEDHVVIYAGATILGRITVGRNSSIGGNVWLTESVPPGSNVTQAQMRTGPSSDAATQFLHNNTGEHDGG